LEVRDLVKRFGGVVAVDRVSLFADEGKVTALVGENAAGKSTLIKCISGALQPDAGTILLHGKPFHFTDPFQSRQAGIETVYQDLALADNLDVGANLFLGRELSYGWTRGFALRKRHIRERALALLSSLDLNIPSVTTQVRYLSGGQRQGIAIARAMEWGSRVVIMDEPTAALGVREARRALNLIVELARSGRAVLVVSHNLEHVFEISDHIWVLRRGRLVAGVTPSQSSIREVVHYITGLAE